MDNELNIDLRKDIIEVALTIESAINSLLILYLNIDNENLKALGNKNSSLSFKNKIDLLSDIEILSKEEHARFIFLMEYRNQFLHNANCNSFVKAVEILGSDRGKQLLKYDNLAHETDIEFKYKNAYRSLFLNCLDTVILKYEKKKEMIAARRKTITDLADYSTYLIDKDSELLGIIMDKCIPEFPNDSKELFTFKLELFNMIYDFSNSMTDNEEYYTLRQKIESFDEERIKAFFK